MEGDKKLECGKQVQLQHFNKGKSHSIQFTWRGSWDLMFCCYMFQIFAVSCFCNHILSSPKVAFFKIYNNYFLVYRQLNVNLMVHINHMYIWKKEGNSCLSSGVDTFFDPSRHFTPYQLIYFPYKTPFFLSVIVSMSLLDSVLAGRCM